MSTTHVSPVRAPAPARTPRGPRTAGGARMGVGMLGAIGLIVVLGLWQIAASTGIVDPSFSSSPFGAVRALGEMVSTGTLWPPLLSTLKTVALGMVISVVLGIPIGLVVGRSHLLNGLTEPIISIMYAVPFVVFLPIIIFWFGIGQQARIVIVVWSAVFPLLINVIAGARNLDLTYLQVARVFTASPLFTMRSVAFPATMPYILSGVRQAVGRALVGAIVAELFMGSEGLGYVVQLQTSNFRMDDAMAAIVVIAILAIALTRGVAWFERRFTFWSSSV